MNKAKCESILEQLKARAEWSEDYYTSNTDNPVAEYVDSIGYSGELLHMVEDSLMRLDRQGEITEEQVKYLQNIIKTHSRNEASRLIRELCTLDFEDSYYRRDRELCSMTLGEIEEQIDDIEGADDLTDEERDHIFSEASDFCHITKDMQWMTVDMGYGRWYLQIDEDLLDEAMKKVEKEIPVVKKANLKLISGGVR